MYFIYKIRSERPGFAEAMLPMEEEAMARHFRYIQAMYEEGRIIHVGRCTDKSFGIVIFLAADEAEAQRIANADPAVAEGVVLADVHEYIPVFHSAGLPE